MTSTSPAAASDLRDGVTGQVIDATSSLFRCENCDVRYQPASVDLLRQENGGRCAACGSTAIASITQHSPTTDDGRPPETAIATLANYRWLEGQVVIFEGLCLNVYPSRTGSSYAVVFEEAPWDRGFKLVIRRAAVPHIGVDFIRNLVGKRIRVCGPIVKDPVFGYEIILKDRSTILGVWS